MRRIVADAEVLTTSALTALEFERAVMRLEAERVLSNSSAHEARNWCAALLQRCSVFPIDSTVLHRASQPFPLEPVRAGDAIHLATADGLRGKLHWFTVVSHDKRLRDNAAALGLRVVPDPQ